MNQWPKFRGRKELRLHLGGKRLQSRQAIIAKSYDCEGYYDGGAKDCGIPGCPLYPFMPYRDKKSS